MIFLLYFIIYKIITGIIHILLTNWNCKDLGGNITEMHYSHSILSVKTKKK